MSDDFLRCISCGRMVSKLEWDAFRFPGIYRCCERMTLLPFEVDETTVVDSQTAAIAKANWDADRARLKENAPEWLCSAWSKAPAWRRRPYLQAAKFGKHPDKIESNTDAE